ncbi:hypothetical protein [Phaeovulum sp. W22_SRMD_FR3]|uniref:hypothetical protein n=1 Tax=Phaeovulum sp. W22_SRMD_FR3 TaxID=3240274 RepID=UPI003F9E51C8
MLLMNLALAAGILAMGMVTPDLASAAQLQRAGKGVFRVSKDPGGSVAERVAEINRLRAQGARVEIAGGCWSSCTMYLGLPNTCVTRAAVLGFHGPSSAMYGIGLPSAEFERSSKQMASYYPEPIRSWFLREGRMITVGFTKFSGRDLIRMGVRECST